MSIVGSEQWMYSAGAEFYDFPIEQSLRFNRADSTYLNRTASSPTLGTKATWSFWIKKCDVVSDTNGSYRTVFYCGTPNVDGFRIGFAKYSGNNHVLHISQDNGSSAAYIFMRTEAALRDTSAWYNFVIRYDSTDATAADRIKVYINGELASIQSSPRTNPPLNHIPKWQVSGTTLKIGKGRDDDNEHYDMYLADVNFVDGTALDATSFGETKSGIWIPKDTADLTFGTNGFRLEYADSAAIGDDTSGNTNDWTANSLVASDVVLDSPTNNFAVLRNMGTPPASGASIKEGNLHYTTGSSGSGRNLNRQAISTILPTSGKWYAECRVQSSTNQFIGVGPYQVEIAPTSNNTRYSYIRPLAADVYTRTGASETITNNYGSAGAVGDVYGIYLDLDASPPEVYYSKNGSWGDGSGNFDEATPTTAITLGNSFRTEDTGGNEGVGFIFSSAAGATSVQGIWNFGQDSTFAGNETAGGNTDANGIGDFFSTVPDDALALCTANLPSGAIDTLADETPEEYFNTVLYTGNGTTDTSITSVGFQPSLTWVKQRSGTEHHQLTDAVRGAPRTISSSGTFAENNNAERLKSFDSDGFTLGNDIAVNQSSQTYVGWNWKANGSGVSNTDGSITSTVSVGATSQQNWFSVASFTGTGANATVGHGLGVTPDMIIVKGRDNTDQWFVYHTGTSSSPENDYIYLNLTNAKITGGANPWNGTAHTSSVFNLGSDGGVNGSSLDYIAYCFASADGLCKVGSYTGNGSSDGTFIYTGFRPAFILTKVTSTTNHWGLWDNKRLGRNPTEHYLIPNLSNAEGSASSTGVDFLSNGFKFRGGSAIGNQSGQSFIYLAIAEQPFKYANAR